MASSLRHEVISRAFNHVERGERQRNVKNSLADEKIPEEDTVRH